MDKMRVLQRIETALREVQLECQAEEASPFSVVEKLRLRFPLELFSARLMTETHPEVAIKKAALWGIIAIIGFNFLFRQSLPPSPLWDYAFASFVLICLALRSFASARLNPITASVLIWGDIMEVIEKKRPYYTPATQAAQWKKLATYVSHPLNMRPLARFGYRITVTSRGVDLFKSPTLLGLSILMVVSMLVFAICIFLNWSSHGGFTANLPITMTGLVSIIVMSWAEHRRWDLEVYALSRDARDILETITKDLDKDGGLESSVTVS
jgi:hypothetical protein